MRLFGKLTGAIGRYFRAAWQMPPFDRAARRMAADACVCAAQVSLPTATAGQVAQCGALAAVALCAGAVAGSVGCDEC